MKHPFTRAIPFRKRRPAPPMPTEQAETAISGALPPELVGWDGFKAEERKMESDSPMSGESVQNSADET